MVLRSTKQSDHFDSYEPRADRPAVGSTWIWERDKPHAREKVTVTRVNWNDEEWWVETESQSGRYWNDLSRFWEACWPDPDPNDVPGGGTLRWNGRPAFARALPSGWQPLSLGSSRDWSKVGDDLWRRVGSDKDGYD